MGNQNGDNHELFARALKKCQQKNKSWPDVELNLFASVLK